MNLMEQLGFPSEAAAKIALMEELKKAGAVRMEAHYSGGNDEGGVDDLKLFNEAEKEITAPERGQYRDPVGDERGFGPNGQVYVYDSLWQAADDMLSTEFGSWAGEYSAYGVLHANLKEDKVWRDGQMSSYDDDHRDY